MIFTFSTKGSRPTDTQVVQDVKKYCEDNGLNFSALIVKQLREFKESVDVKQV